jgi:acyl CoA:acetate/3-ketoacid CoA transferase
MAPHQAIVPTSTMMDFYVGGGIDYAFLGVGEAGLNPRKTSGPLHSALIDPGFFQWIGLRENLQETMVFTIKYRGFL